MKTHYLLQFLYCTALITAVSVTGLRAQDLYKLSGSKENSIKVLGTSNVHDWTMEAQNPTAEASFLVKAKAVAVAAPTTAAISNNETEDDAATVATRR